MASLLSWASLYAYLQARTPGTVEHCLFIVNVERNTTSLTVNHGQPMSAPVTVHDLQPLIDSYTAGILPEGARVKFGEINIDYVGNAAAVTVYYVAADGSQQRVTNDHKF